MKERSLQSEDVVCYSYWFYQWSLIVALLKHDGIVERAVSRVHFADLYQYVKKTPFAQFKLRALDKSILISQHGYAYFQKEGDLDFHYQIVKGAKNDHLAKQILGDMYHLLRMYRYQCSLSEGRPQLALKEHRSILDAIADRDGDLAEMLMRKHIRKARENISAQYNQQDFDLINEATKKPQRSKT